MDEWSRISTLKVEPGSANRPLRRCSASVQLSVAREPALWAALDALGQCRGSLRELLRPLGAGSQFAAFATRQEPAVCIKVSPQCPEALRREAALLARVRHVAFPALLHDGSRRGFLVEELVTGTRLSRLHSSFLRARLPRLAADLSAILRVLTSLEPAMVHGDLKPNDLFWCDGSLRLVDLGSARREGDRGDRLPHLGLSAGFRAPELLGGAFEVDRRSDVFAAAAILFAIVSGSSPPARPEAGDAFQRRLADCPPALREALLGALHPRVQDRSPTIEPIVQALSATILDGVPHRAARPGVPPLDPGGDRMETVPAQPANETTDARFTDTAFVVAKVTSRCNLSCAYCYDDAPAREDMALPTFRQLVSEVIRSSRHSRLRFVMHGGEASLMSGEWLAGAVQHVRTEARVFGKAAHIGLQSNLVGLDEEKLSLLKRLGVSLGVSLDGPPDLPGAMRPLAARAIEHYALARSLGLRVGIIVTVNGGNWSEFRRIMHWLRADLGAIACKVNTVTPVGRGANLPWLSADQIATAYRDIVDTMIELDGAIVEEGTFREIRRFLSGAREAEGDTLCSSLRCGAGTRVVCSAPDGTLLPCGRFTGADACRALGNVFDAPDGATVERWAHTVANLHREAPEVWRDCAGCEARVICSFGCRAFVLRSAREENVDCLPTRSRYAYYRTIAPALERLVRRRGARMRGSLRGMLQSVTQR